ncbi:hypothetical protein FNH04_43220 [Streptomyces phyllanthi]|uniref:DUF1289 domain-containing protein n=1 Tax=Streptomyces phyllanthi TaxID=1803180 RepID=A0A5N8WHU1_9ACTN|nr:hypothetical protein [Streptomyces phyllanthi]
MLATPVFLRGLGGESVRFCSSSHASTPPGFCPGCVADWDDLPTWQQETDSDISGRIEQTVRAEVPQRYDLGKHAGRALLWLP